jgi:predicted metal-dependent peptidase
VQNTSHNAFEPAVIPEMTNRWTVRDDRVNDGRLEHVMSIYARRDNSGSFCDATVSRIFPKIVGMSNTAHFEVGIFDDSFEIV